MIEVSVVPDGKVSLVQVQAGVVLPSPAGALPATTAGALPDVVPVIRQVVGVPLVGQARLVLAVRVTPVGLGEDSVHPPVPY